MTESLENGNSTVAADAEGASLSPRADADSVAGVAPSQKRAPRRSLPRVREAQGQPRKNIVWIASYPKSGNTWVRVFIHNLIREMRGETEGSQDINDLGRFAIWEHSLPHFTKVLGKPPAQATMEEIARARPQVQRLLSAEQPNLALAKTHLCFGNDHGYPTIEPSVTKGAIYIVRDPRDVAISYAHHCGKSIDTIIQDMATPAFHIPATAGHVGETIGSWSQHLESWLSPKLFPIHVVRFEDMLAKPIETFGKMARFLGMVSSDSEISHAIQNSSFNELARQEKEKGFNERPKAAKIFFREGKFGEWPKYLSSSQVCTIAEHQGKAMAAMGYLAEVSARVEAMIERSVGAPPRPSVGIAERSAPGRANKP